ncbi:MAG: transporter substrate-binding domain-containing protein [Deltaproteobacteria bacterium]|nr:transporter substrate-binding domain-containing protein [Deltaproteobacteria bacterium]
MDRFRFSLNLRSRVFALILMAAIPALVFMVYPAEEHPRLAVAEDKVTPPLQPPYRQMQDNAVGGDPAFPKRRLSTIIVDNYYPYTFVNRQGVPEGFSVDLVKAVAKVMGLEIDIQVGPWERAREALETGRIDMLPMMAYSKERAKLFDFSEPHTISHDAVFTAKKNGQLNSIKDLAGKTLIVMKNDAAHDYLTAKGLTTPDRLILTDSLPEALRLLAIGKGDAALMPKLVGLLHLKNLGLSNLEQSPILVDEYHRFFSFAVKKGNKKLLDRLSEGLSIIKATGEYDRIHSKWFGLVDPPKVTLQSVMKYILLAIAAFLFVVLFLAVWSLSMKKQVFMRTKELEQEIVERKKTEKALLDTQQQAAFLADLLEHSSLPFGVSYSDGRLGICNAAFPQLLGYSKEEFIKLDWAKDITPPEWLESEQAVLEELHRTGHPVRYEKELVRKDGVRVSVELLVHLRRDEEGQPPYYYAFITDISERKQAEEALKENEKLLKRAQQIAQLGHWRLDPKTNRVDGSDELFRIFGLARDDFALEAFVSIVHPDDRDFVVNTIQDSTKNIRGCDIEYRLLCRDGSHKFIKALSEPVVNQSGQLSMMVGTVQDITERKKAEEQQKKLESQLLQAHKMEAIGTLAGGIAHDFNNILGCIFGYTQLALDDDKSGAVNREFLEEILKAAKRARDLVKQILAVSRKSDQEKIPFEVSPIIKESIKLIRASLPANIVINHEISPKETYILGDPTQIHQVLINLCTNAAHAMQENGGVLDIKLNEFYLDPDSAARYIKMDPGPYLKLTVSDTGHGMESKVVARIFDPFFTTKEVGKGTGMGLAIVHGIVRSHGGAISVYSEPGRGSTFNIILPLAKGEVELVSDDVETIHRGSETILLVDDELGLIDTGKKILTRLGYKVITKTGSLEALEAFVQQPDSFDLVVTDMTMPTMTGDKLAQEIIRLRPNIPIILCTGFSEAVSEEKAGQIGIKGFLMKPLDMAVTAKLIRRLLDE